MDASASYEIIGHRTTRLPVLFLHGFLGNRAEWRDLARSLSEGSMCLLIDLPGHGQNNQLQVPGFTLDDWTNSLSVLLRQLDIPKVNIVGYSMGGRLALCFATAFPDHCHRMILESASPGLKTELERNERIRSDEHLVRRLEEHGLESFLDFWYDQPLFASLGKRSHLLADLKERRLNNDPAGLAASLRVLGTGRQPSLWDSLGKIGVPLLLLAGEKDAKYSRIARQMADLCPKAEVRIISDTGHNVHLEQPEQFKCAVQDFLITGK